MRLGLYSKGLVGAAFAAGFPQLAAELATDAVSIWVMTSCVSIFHQAGRIFFFRYVRLLHLRSFGEWFPEKIRNAFRSSPS